MSQPRVAVVGGGIAGTLCSLVLKNRGLRPVLIDQGLGGLGGRMRGGAQFLRAADPQLAQVAHMLEQQGLLRRWEGRFGVLGSASGGFLPAEFVTQNRAQPPSGVGDETMGGGVSTRATASDGGDFCNFIEGSTAPTYVGIPSMVDLCPEICRLADIETVGNTKIIGATPVPEGGWKLAASGGGLGDETFDAMVVASHDPSFASGMVKRIVDAEVAAGGSAEGNEEDQSTTVIRKLTELSEALQALKDLGRLPVYTLMATFPTGFSSKIPFDGASVPGSPHIQYLSRRISDHADDVDKWFAVSTSRLAAEMLSSPHLLHLSDAEKLSSVSLVASEEMSRLLLPFHGEAGLIPIDSSAKRWGSAFSSQGLNLKEDSVTLAPWRLAICGDFVRDMSVHATPIEAAALSGLEAGERTASLFT